MIPFQSPCGRPPTWEGANEFTVFWKIIIPLSKPIIVYTVINSFLAPWMDFIFASIMLNSGVSAQKTVALGLFAMVDKVNRNNYFAQFCAGGVIVSIPISVLFIMHAEVLREGHHRRLGEGITG